MRWFTDTLKVVFVSIFSFSASAVLVIISSSQETRPLGISVPVPPLTWESEPAKSPIHSSVEKVSSTNAPAVGAVSGKDSDSMAKPADSEKITSQKVTSQKAASQEVTLNMIRPETVDPETVKEEGLVQSLSRGQPEKSFTDLFAFSKSPTASRYPVAVPHAQSNHSVALVSSSGDHQIFDKLAASIGSEQAPAWLHHAAAASQHDIDRPFIAIVMDDFGLNHRALEQILKLPGPLTLAFLPYADDLPSQTSVARRAGHEVMVHVPMQPRDPAHDPGPNVLDSGMSAGDLSARLDWALSRFDGYVGINNHMGSAFTTDPDGMRVVMSSLAERGLLFLDSVTSSDTLGPRMARSAGVPYARRHVFLDHQRDPESIQDQLGALEDIALRQGYAVGIGHPHQITIAALAQWLPTLQKKGIALGSVAHVVMRRQATLTTPSVVAFRPIDQ